MRVHKHLLLLSFFITLYIAYFTTASFLRHDNFYTGRYDLGNMDQVVWNTSWGRIFQTSTDFDNDSSITSRLAAHADFILIVISPLYFLWSNPKMLLLLQTVVVAAGAIFVFLLAQRILNNKHISLLFSFIFLVNPSVNYANLYDFHAVVLATTFLLGTMYFLITKRYLWFLLFAVISGLSKEQIWIIVAILGIYLAVFTKKRLLGTLMAFVSALVFYYLIWVAIPNVRGSHHFALSYYSEFGVSPANIIKNVFFNPQKTLSLILQPDRLRYLYQLFLPLGFLPILSPLFLIFAAPDLLINLLSNNYHLHQIYYHYSATITPFLFVAAIFGIKSLRKLFPKIPLAFYGTFLMLATLYSAYSFGPLPFTKKPNIDMFTKPRGDKEIIHAVLSKIPKSNSVSATNNLGAHLSHRQVLFTIPSGVEKTDFVVFLLGDSFAQPSPQKQREMARDLKNNKNYTVFFEKGDFVVFQRKIP